MTLRPKLHNVYFAVAAFDAIGPAMREMAAQAQHIFWYLQRVELARYAMREGLTEAG